MRIRHQETYKASRMGYQPTSYHHSDPAKVYRPAKKLRRQRIKNQADFEREQALNGLA
jgi:hypothetical protein